MHLRLALFLLLLLAPKAEHNNKQTVGPCNAETTSQKTNEIPPSGIVNSQIVVNQPDCQSNQKQGKHEGVDKTNAIDGVNSFSTAAIALFTVLTFFVFRGQLRATKIAERAWVVSKAISELPVYGSSDHQPESFPVRFLAANEGRTPAWITAMGSKAHLLAKGQTLPGEPTYDWGGPFPTEGTVLPPHANIPQGADITIGDLANIEKGLVTFYFYGVIRYRDIFRQKHETKYCYVFKAGSTKSDPSPRDFYIGGPAGYNRAT